jgi:hypothetical protein
MVWLIGGSAVIFGVVLIVHGLIDVRISRIRLSPRLSPWASQVLEGLTLA